MIREEIVTPNSNGFVKISGPTLPWVPTEQCENCQPGVLCSMHFHRELEFLMMLGGSMRCSTATEDFILNEGDILLIGSGIPHETEKLVKKTCSVLLQFRSPNKITGPEKYLARFMRSSFIGCYCFRAGLPETEELRTYMVALNNEYNKKGKAYEHYINGYVSMILALLYRKEIIITESDLFSKKDVEKLLPVLEYICENYAEPISLSDVCGVVNLNEYYFCRLFKKITGSTLTEYINFVRVCMAEKLFMSDVSITEISYQSGFSSLSYFNRVFKKYKGYSPSEFKKIVENKSDFFIED